MGKKIFISLVVALIGMLVLPALASATLVNEYGLHFAGQSDCLGCHSRMTGDLKVTAALHGKFATQGIQPGAPENWTMFRAAGDAPQVPGTNGALWDGGGTYDFKLPWVTLGDSTGNSATEYLFFKGSTDPTVMPWNLIEGLSWEPSGEWMIAAEEPSTGLFDVTYGCQRCHQLGTTMKGAAGKAVPNPAASIAATPGTAVQWARDESKSVNDFMTDPTVSYPGLGIQCEQCHGTGQYDAAGGHMGTQVNVSGDLETLGQSQVCGQCHGSYTNLSTTLGIYGYTPNLAMRDFVDINGVSGGQSYTTIPSDDDFAKDPTAYWMYPNGSNAKGNHYYYNEWAASAHSYKAAYTADDPEAFAYQASGKGVYSNNLFGTNTVAAGCYKCHTGEGYLQTKGDPIAQDFTPTQDNVGKMGQECLTCHNGHPSAVGAEDVVREPDQAGVRSAKGLNVSNQSICEDCHNWQMEVLGTTPNPVPMADLSAHGGASHPQRETLHARSVMYDVADGSEYMPGAKCENCHMPKTNKAETRISHGMKPMLPGDAAKWQEEAGYHMGQDSCSTCHPSRTRDELQANIDEWQSAAETQAAAVVAAIDTAKTSSEFSATDSSKPGYVLVGRATWNYKAYENDASGSVHNPRYIMAGLKKAEQEALSVGGYYTHAAAKSPVKKNHNGHVVGRIVNGDKSAATGAKVILMRGSKIIGTTLSDATGNFAFTFKVTKTYKNYKVKWVRSGSSTTDLYSKTLKIKCKK
jgi:Cytochrome c552